MVAVDKLVEKALDFLNRRADENYRIVICIVGPPGSGKSTIAEKFCNSINEKYHEYLKSHLSTLEILKIKENNAVDLVSDLNEISPERETYLRENNGIFPDSVENINFQCIQYKPENDTDTFVLGRGGLPNSIKISKYNDLDLPQNPEEIDIAQIIPMDGFHLSRSCLDMFKDPEYAHKRRGSPTTFDSNNYLELCKILSKTSKMIPEYNFETSKNLNVFDKISNSFTSNIQDIYVPGFNHALKDPTRDQYCINGFSRVLIFEGLYLLYDQENWKEIYKTLQNTGALLVWNIDIDEKTIEQRVAKRHFESGLVNTLEEGIKKFQSNDLLNARSIFEHTINVNDIIHITNE